ncbi:MAG TPA: iron-containing alcohol dehydrogenase [Thiobacillaceae bacterium]|nr:iron-containing alcohol dehydrogenase [Thiobacillaceae bacterium]
MPRIAFGAGRIRTLPRLAHDFGRRALLVTGRRSFRGMPQWEDLLSGLRTQGITYLHMTVDGEPSPQLVDQVVADFQGEQIDVVIGIGGGSALDAAKAIAGLLKPGNSVMDHLEGVGPELPYRGPVTPFIAVPTTAGTGSEATKNAVLSLHGEDGFKKSFRDEKLVAEIALVDPDLLASCPAEIIAANGMDAFTQLLESYVSSKANRFTDALAWSGMKAVRNSLLVWHEQGPQARDAQSGMAYAALMSGITLAQVGLGSVHGLASPLGALFPIPHGVVCGTLVAEATRVNIQALKNRDQGVDALNKYAQVGRLLGRDGNLPDESALERLLEILADWTARLKLPRLGPYGIRRQDIPRIVANSRGSSMKTNPVVLNDDEIGAILSARL